MPSALEDGDAPGRAIVASIGRVAVAAREELNSLQPRLRLTLALARALPEFSAMRSRTLLLRGAGLNIGRGTVLFGVPRIYGGERVRQRLVIGARVVINRGCTIEVNQDVVLADGVALGPEVMILTMSHQLGPSSSRAGPLTAAPVHIGTGAWIGARAIILPGVTIGAGAVVSAGSVVNKDVPPHSLVTGVPAEVTVRRLPGR